jgi:glycosyltransferase involved in cell wall biosynthesis
VSQPTVSVLIPCFNAERYIGETLESVLRQTWPALEVIVVDDGSTDGSAGVIDRFARDNLRYLRQSNAGAAAARNRAFAESRGPFIQFLDADDLLDRDKIERQMVRLVNRPDCVASSEWGRFFGEPASTQFNPEPVWSDLDPLEWLVRARESGEMLFPAIWLVPRSVVGVAGMWDETLTLGDDGEYFTRVLLAAREVLFCSGARCRYRSGVVGSLSGRKSPEAWASQFRVIELCEAHVRTREDSERVRRGFSLSWQHFAHACYPYDAAQAQRALDRAMKLHPVTVLPDGGFVFRMLSRVVGWRTARLLQVASGRP